MEPLNLIAAVLLVPTLFFVPGFLTFHIFRVDKSGLLPPLERGAIQVLLSVLLVGALALGLAVVGAFSVPFLLLSILGYGVLLLIKVRFRPSLSSAVQCSTVREMAFVLSLIGLASLLFARPFEDIWGFDDAYIHVMIGAAIAQHGSIVFHDPLLMSLPEALMQQFLWLGDHQFNSFVVTDLASGQIHPRLLHLNAAWIAILYSVTGLGGSLYITPAFGTLSVVLLYFAGKHLFGWKVGAVASLLLTVSYLQIWFSRSHSAETLLQLLLIGGILAFVLAQKLESRFLAAVSAGSFGLSMVTAIEAGLVVFPLALVFSALRVLGRGRPHHSAFFLAFAAFLGLVFLYYATVARDYVVSTVTAPDVPGTLAVVLLGVVIAPAILPLAARTALGGFIQERRRWFQHLVAGGVVAFVAYALVTYPDTPIGRFGRNLEMLGWYLTPLVVALGIVGILLMVYRIRMVAGVVFLSVMLVFFLYFVATIHHSWGAPWWMRRYIFAAVPLLFLGTGVFLDFVHGIFARGWHQAVPVGLFVLLVSSTLAVSYPIHNFVQYEGSITQIEALFAPYGQDDVLVFADLTYPHAAFSLRYVYGNEALLMRRDLWGPSVTPRGSEDVEDFVEAYLIWRDQGKRVFVVNPSSKFLSAFQEQLAFTLDNEGIIEVPYLQFSTISFPTEVVRVVRPIRIFEVHFAQPG